MLSPWLLWLLRTSSTVFGMGLRAADKPGIGLGKENQFRKVLRSGTPGRGLEERAFPRPLWHMGISLIKCSDGM